MWRDRPEEERRTETRSAIPLQRNVPAAAQRCLHSDATGSAASGAESKLESSKAFLMTLTHHCPQMFPVRFVSLIWLRSRAAAGPSLSLTRRTPDEPSVTGAVTRSAWYCCPTCGTSYYHFQKTTAAVFVGVFHEFGKNLCQMSTFLI